MKQGKDLRKYLYECEALAPSDFVFAQSEALKEFEEGGHISPNSTLDNTMAFHTSSGSKRERRRGVQDFGLHNHYRICEAETKRIHR
uniref:Uncharacterized protein n=1 Tax=Picea sitchensis TaxID=3332 RepID=D5ACY6_PICSI|nr:unknown [Picea sitchensis]